MVINSSPAPVKIVVKIVAGNGHKFIFLVWRVIMKQPNHVEIDYNDELKMYYVKMYAGDVFISGFSCEEIIVINSKLELVEEESGNVLVLK